MCCVDGLRVVCTEALFYRDTLVKRAVVAILCLLCPFVIQIFGKVSYVVILFYRPVLFHGQFN